MATLVRDMDGPHIASLDLLAVHADGSRAPVALRVAAPERAPTGEWRCAVRLDGLHDRLVPIHGEDSLQALCLALGLAAMLLRNFVARDTSRASHLAWTTDSPSRS